MQAMSAAKTSEAQKRANQFLCDHEILAVTAEIGGPKAVHEQNMGKLYAELVERFQEADLDLPYKDAGAFWRRANNIDRKREGQIEAAVSVGMLAFNAIGYGLNERANLGLVGLAGQVRFAHCIGLIEPLAVVYSIASCALWPL